MSHNLSESFYPKTGNGSGVLIRNKPSFKVKEELSKPTVLALYYDPERETKVSADISSYGLGAVLLQKTSSDWQPVAYASRSLSETERWYTQVEKESLAIT